MFCRLTIRLSRPNSATYHGTPAAGTQTLRARSCSCIRSAPMSSTDWVKAR